ncbi:hypothetical protein ACFXKG_35315 [Streptomyces sp. NPDC059255]|uniref:hypothetical protein n=1 Tax=Streptomyces sp. NPDC059255 TaxID=3346793 RepID=UPI00369E62F6
MQAPHGRPQQSRTPAKKTPAASTPAPGADSTAYSEYAALQSSAGNAAVARMIEQRGPAHGTGHGSGPGAGHGPGPGATAQASSGRAGLAVQRTVDYTQAPWSRQHLAPDAFTALLSQASGGEQPGKDFSVPYRDLFETLNASSETVAINEQAGPSAGSRALFALAPEGVGGTLQVAPPGADASAAELRKFAATMTHEMQHALDSVEKRYGSKEKPQNMRQRKISTELRAFGREAAAALKLAMGDTYDRGKGTLTQILSSTPEGRLTPERNQLAREFHILDSYHRGRKPIRAAFAEQPQGLQIGIKSSLLLERLAGYLAQYQLVTSTPNSHEALEWLMKEENAEVLQKGLVEGVDLFHQHRPEKGE